MLPHPSLQTKLVLAFMLVLLIPTLVISAYNQLRARDSLIKQASQEALRLADARAAVVESTIAHSATDLLFAAQAPALRRYARASPGAHADVAQHFQSFLRYTAGSYSGICLLDISGSEVVCVRGAGPTAARVPDAQLASRYSEPYFLNALRRASLPGDGPIEISPVDTAASDGPLLRYSTFFTDDRGAPVGVLVLEAPVSPLFALLIDPDQRITTSLTERDGAYLVHVDQQASVAAPPRGLFELQPVDAEIILRQPSGIIVDSAERPGSIQVFTRVRPLGQSAIQWTLIYEQPLAVILSDEQQTQMVTIMITATALVFALLVAHLLARSIVWPVRELAAAAERVGAGDLYAPIPHSGRDEIAALGSTLAHTVGRLRESLQLAEGRRRESETLRAATRALSSTLALGRVLDLILSELRKVVPYDSATVQVLEGDSMKVISAYGIEHADVIIGRRFSLSSPESPNREVALSRAPLILVDAPAQYAIFSSEPFRTDPIRSWIGVPLIFGDQLVGMLALDKHVPGFYTAEHARLAVDFAAQAAIALENARLYEAARQQLAERQRAEAAHARLAAIIETTTDIVAICDFDGRVLFINQAGRRSLGIGLDVDPQAINVSSHYTPEALAQLTTIILPIARRDGVWSGETTMYDSNGQAFPASQVVIVHYAADGSPEFLSAIIRDISERRRVEDELRQAQKMEALGRLAGGLAHDFNNLLTVILGECDLMLGDMPRDDRNYVATSQIRQSGARAAALIRQLLAFSRRQMLQPELLNLNEIIAGMEQLLRRLIGEDLSLTIVLAHDLPTVRADPGQMEQVVMNLAINARDAMPEGGHLLIETMAVLLDSEYARQHADLAPGPYAMIAVTDTGTGIDEAAREHIFEPFFTTKPRGKGTGLGLATVHGIVRQSGGHIWFYSEPDHGSSFKIYLPAAAEPSDALPVEVPLQVEHVITETVLLVEDDEHVRQLARTILLRAGFTVLESSDGNTALELATSHGSSIHALLTDVVMPGGLNGVQVARAVRTLRPDICVVYMSGYTDNALVGRSLVDDHARYLQKPFTPEALVATLLAALAQAGTGRV